MIHVTPTAASKISELLAEEQKDGSGLRVFVQGGGCSGFQYGLMIDEGNTSGDQVFESNGVRLYVDPISVRYLKGAEVDFRRYGDRRRVHHQEPAGRIHLRLRPVLQRLGPVRSRAGELLCRLR
jgi:iron-sulfur cluster assembly accessory protein